MLATAFVSYAVFKFNLIYLIGLFLIIQSAYIMFISQCRPHEDIKFQYLEMMNETLLTVLMYVGLSSSTVAIVNTPETQWTIGYIAIGVSSFMIAINLLLMLF